MLPRAALVEVAEKRAKAMMIMVMGMVIISQNSSFRITLSLRRLPLKVLRPAAEEEAVVLDEALEAVAVVEA